MKKNLFHFSGIRKKLIIYYLIITLIIGLTSVFSYYNAKLVLTKLKTIITDYVYLNDLNNDVDLLMTEVEKYLTTKSSNALLNYYTIYDTLDKKSKDIPREATYHMDSLMMKNIGYLIDDLLLEADSAVKAKRGRISNEYNAHFTRSYEISEYVKQYITQLLNNKLQEGSDQYGIITKNMTFVSYVNAAIIVGAVTLNIILAIIFTYRLTKPIIELAHSAEKISQGNFNIDPVQIHTDDEIKILAKAFDKMVVNIKSHIDDIKTQAEVENRLKEQEMENFKMKSLLKDAELKALQSQINPHFLFNTFNAAGQLAMMEGADRASEFIENIAQLFRYNLRSLDRPVTLKDEINYVKNYMYILKTRFGDKIEFKTEIDKGLLMVKVPCTIIQPIVENAFIHGLENLERNGEIQLKVKEENQIILVEVKDNGIGMELEKIEAIMKADGSEEKIRKHASGIGINNVIDRLRLFYNIDDIQEVFEMESSPGQGTKVTLKLPVGKEVIDD
ncbi:sensor histidine kinase [Alkaliphilus crotonatoxidans]